MTCRSNGVSDNSSTELTGGIAGYLAKIIG